jgi:iron complex outermembrane receptor protein
MNRNNPRLFLLASLLLAFVAPAFAQATGTITGHVFNTVSQEYIRDAEIQVEGTNITVASGTSGVYTLARVPAGEVTLKVTYAGLPPLTSKVTVADGVTVNHELEIGAAPAEASSDGKTLQLETLKVTASVDGNAKALQAQRNSMNMSRSVSSDAFGNVTEGNVGEFLKFLPGVELEYVEADTRGPRLGGMGSQYASVTLDGKGIASADSFGQYVGFENAGAGTANRSFGFDSISINSIESIEINRITSAAMDANAPSGNINLKTKRAFDRKGRFFGMTLSTVLNSEEFTTGKTVGPDDSYSRKYKPNYSLNYSDVFFNNRLGIVLSAQESNVYVEQYRVDHNYNRTPTALDPRPQVLTSVLLKDGPKWTNRASYTAVADFKATEHLTFSLSTLFSQYHAQFYNRQVTMTAGGTRTTQSGDGLLTYGSPTTGAPVGSITLGGGNGVKFTNTFTIVPSFEYKKNNWRVDGSFSSSHSRNDYDNLAHNTVANSAVNNITAIGFSAARSSTEDADWTITQTAGPDWTDLGLQKNPRISDDNRQNTIDIKGGDLNAKYVLPTKIPTFIQFGGKFVRNSQWARNSNDFDKWLYVGPGGGTAGSFVNYLSPFSLYQGSNQPGVAFRSLNGGGAPAFPNRDTLGELFHSNPEYFLQSLPANAATASSAGISLANYESGKYLNQPTYDLVEDVAAGYLMANTRIKGLQLQGGFRYERTEIESTELDPYSNEEVAAAGYAPTASGAPNSTAAIDYKYSRPRVKRDGKYDDLFPSITAKYAFKPNLLFDIGWGKAILRPDLAKLSNTRTVDDTNEIINTPNTNLQPERSQKIAAALSYFFGNAGINNAQIVYSRTNVTNKFTQLTISAEEYGNTDPDYADYEFRTWVNIDTPVTYNSLEYSYQQYLSFLPRLFQGTSVIASYTNTFLDDQLPPGPVQHELQRHLAVGFRRVPSLQPLPEGKHQVRPHGEFPDDGPPEPLHGRPEYLRGVPPPDGKEPEQPRRAVPLRELRLELDLRHPRHLLSFG